MFYLETQRFKEQNVSKQWVMISISIKIVKVLTSYDWMRQTKRLRV